MRILVGKNIIDAKHAYVVVAYVVNESLELLDQLAWCQEKHPTLDWGHLTVAGKLDLIEVPVKPKLELHVTEVR